MSAYNGGVLRLGAFWRPLAIDLSGLRSRSKIPILLDHDSTQIVGQAHEVNIGRDSITLSGSLTGSDEPGQKVLDHARGGFEWQASVGVQIDKLESIGEDTEVNVNGKAMKGPLLVVRAGRLGEVSFVAIGADETTSVKVAASAAGVETMDFEKWLTAKGFVVETLSDEQKTILRASYDAEYPADNPPKNKEPDDAAVKAEAARIADIKAAKAPNDLETKAIEEGWTRQSLEAAWTERKQAGRPAPPVIHSREKALTPKILEAAIRLGSEEKREIVEQSYPPEVLDAADPHRRLGLRALIELACRMDGKPCPSLSANIADWVRAGFSTTNLSGILGNAANRMMLSAYMAVPSAARILFRKLSANDFKTHTGYRLGGDAKLEKVGSGGELKHGTLEETSFTFNVDTYGRLIALTRQQWINDDMGAFTQIPLRIGRGAGQAIESAAWALVIANTGNFFYGSNSNYISGAATALGITAMDTAVRTMREMVDDKGEPIMVVPKFLVVPPALEGEARRLFVSDSFVATGVGSTAAKSVSANTYKGAFEPVVVPHLKAYTTAWYLWGDPQDVAPFGLAFLNGVETPVIEEVDLPAEYLGRAWRGYIDFGVCQMETQGAVKSAGA